jgi:hypothetical protein
MLWFSGKLKQSVVLNSQAFIDATEYIRGVGGIFGSKDRCLPCATNILVNTRQGRRVAQAALELCRSLEHRDLRTSISITSSNADFVACRASTPWKSRQHKRPRGTTDRGERREASGAVRSKIIATWFWRSGLRAKRGMLRPLAHEARPCSIYGAVACSQVARRCV